jgi:phenylpropionate dioxygenase-like ring-hydroxylating dioxygenase large terminal subunit
MLPSISGLGERPLIGCTDRIALDAWHVAAALEDLDLGKIKSTRLLDTDIKLCRGDDGVDIWYQTAGVRTNLPVCIKFGYVWTSLGKPGSALFDIPQFDEPDRRRIHAASIGVNVSAPRAVENFLDMGHFAFVHTGYLGVEPHTAVKPYKVSVTADEVIATECFAYQPLAALSATKGYDVEYVYRVPHPYCAVLYKTNPIDPTREDVIGLFLQPCGQERVIAHLTMSYLDDVSTDLALRGFQLLIFGQDKPILENQTPKRLPLDPMAEMSAKADAGSWAYRRWLRERGVSYGTIPVNAQIPA